jgi:hypothetical protein
MTPGFALYAIPITWFLSFLFYGLAGFLIWRRLIPRNPHIVLTVCGFMADFVAYFFQIQYLLMLAATEPSFALDPELRSWQTVLTNLSMAMYCVTAVFGFSRMVGWHGIGRWHVPVAALFIITLVGSRVLYFQLF